MSILNLIQHDANKLKETDISAIDKKGMNSHHLRPPVLHC